MTKFCTSVIRSEIIPTAISAGRANSLKHKLKCISCWACSETLDSFQGNDLKALEKHWMWTPLHRPVGWPDQCLLHQRFGLDLFISQIDPSCFASRHLYNKCTVVWSSRGRALQESTVHPWEMSQWRTSFFYFSILLFVLNVPSGLWLQATVPKTSSTSFVKLNSVLASNVLLLCLRALCTVLMRVLYSLCEQENVAKFAVSSNMKLSYWYYGCTGNALGNMKVVIAHTSHCLPASWG